MKLKDKCWYNDTSVSPLTHFIHTCRDIAGSASPSIEATEKHIGRVITLMDKNEATIGTSIAALPRASRDK